MAGRNARETDKTVAARRVALRRSSLAAFTSGGGAVATLSVAMRSLVRSGARIRRIRVYRTVSRTGVRSVASHHSEPPPRVFLAGRSRGGARRARGGKRKRKERESVAYPIQRGILLAPAEANVPRGLPRGREVRDGRRERCDNHNLESSTDRWPSFWRTDAPGNSATSRRKCELVARRWPIDTRTA